MSRTKLRAIPGAIRLDEARRREPIGSDGFEKLQIERHLILDAAGEGIYGIDLRGRATFVNPAATAMTGHTPEELLGQSMHEIVHHSHPDGSPYPSADCPIYAAFNDGMVRKVGDEVFWRKDGTSFPVEYTSTPLMDSGRLVGAVVVFRDVTIRKQTEDRLRQALSEVERLKERLQEENRYLKAQIHDAASAHELVGNSPALRRVLELIERAAPTDATVLIEGESGTGKELVCRAVHQLSPRRRRALVSLNCAAVSPALIESELFGHERGAFTGASSQRMGRFELAEGGTLFLDEIGEMPLEAQAKLLRVLQEHEFERVGGSRTLRSSARIVAATNRDLRELVARGRFRSDLFYRLYVLPIRVPPLRERRTDIPMLAEHFRKRCEAKWGRSFSGILPESLERMLEYSWPGNVRELEHAIERAALVCDGPWLELGPLCETRETRDAPPAAPDRLDEVQRQHILNTLRNTGFRISGPHGAAAVLGMHPNTLRYRMKKLGIDRPR